MTDETAPAMIHENLFEHVSAFVLEHAKPSLAITQDPLDGTTGLFIQKPNGQLEAVAPESFDGFRANPVRRTGTAVLLSLDSFIAHANRFKNPDSAIFADNNRNAPSVTAVLDYHESVEARVEQFAKESDDDGNVGVARIPRAPLPQWGDHRGRHSFPLSDEWKAWIGMNKQAMAMKDFAAFLEDHIIDVLHPSDLAFGDDSLKFINAYGGIEKLADPAKLIELSQSFHVYENAQVRETKKLSDGTGTILFDVTNVDADGKPVAIPTMFGIWIPVFKMERPVPILARLRYRIANGAPVFWYELWRTDKVFDEAFDNALNKVREETALPVFLGNPEA